MSGRSRYHISSSFPASNSFLSDYSQGLLFAILQDQARRMSNLTHEIDISNSSKPGVDSIIAFYGGSDYTTHRDCSGGKIAHEIDLKRKGEKIATISWTQSEHPFEVLDHIDGKASKNPMQLVKIPGFCIRPGVSARQWDFYGRDGSIQYGCQEQYDKYGVPTGIYLVGFGFPKRFLPCSFEHATQQVYPVLGTGPARHYGKSCVAIITPSSRSGIRQGNATIKVKPGITQPVFENMLIFYLMLSVLIDVYPNVSMDVPGRPHGGF